MKAPSLEEIRRVHSNLSDEIIETPVKELNPGLFLKLELQQKTGSFKLRGALSFMRSLSSQQLQKGVTAFSGGNHAVAVSYAAKAMGISAKVAMPSFASPLRISKCRDYGAEVLLSDDRSELINITKRHELEEGRTLVHPFDHPLTVTGAAGVGFEFLASVPNLQIVFVPIGGGGLAAGVSCAIKQINPTCKVIGVQARTADAMFKSFKTGKPERNDNPHTVADSLCPPQVGSYTYLVCKEFLDDICIVEETEIKQVMRVFYDRLGVMVEGAGAIATAAALKVSKDKVVGAIVSGSNIDEKTFNQNVQLA